MAKYVKPTAPSPKPMNPVRGKARTGGGSVTTTTRRLPKASSVPKVRNVNAYAPSGLRRADSIKTRIANASANSTPKPKPTAPDRYKK